MKLTLEEKKGLSQLSGYFKKLEMTCTHLGFDLDDYILEYRDNSYAQFVEIGSNTNAQKRKEVFEKSSRRISAKAKTVKTK